MRKALVGCLLSLGVALPVWTQTMNTVAGNSSWGDVFNIALDSAGNLYAADKFYNKIYKVDRLGATTTIAGTGTAGYSGDGALATAAQLNQPYGVAVAADGTVYISDFANERIRKVAPNGIITTVAGTGRAGFSGDGGAATAAQIYRAFGNGHGFGRQSAVH